MKKTGSGYKKEKKSKKKLKTVLSMLINGEPLPPRCREHKLAGNYKDRQECHIEPDWLLIYKIAEADIIFERTGSHSDLFK
ncbi:MAG TPA: type II toxin-antitoxin system YafQ family toxin [Desulfobacterales bacterium]|nr:type II toxin-antitoxin system YafQ family toxin [Desulfobacterales bacterium]